VKKLLLIALTLLPGLALAATPPEGVEPQVRRGFFVETDVGVFFTLGGAHAYSNAQTYLQLGVGYDINDKVELGAHFGLGASAANCYGGLTPGGGCLGSENFTVTFLDASAAYLFHLGERIYLAPKVLAGWTMLDPSPLASQGLATTGTPNAGVGLGVEYATPMDHFSVGAEVLVRFIVGPNIPAFSIFPRIKYTF
jgi:hypothetical protein